MANCVAIQRSASSHEGKTETGKTMALAEISSNWPPIRRALIVATIVGPILTLINQWSGIFGYDDFSVLKCCLTMCVPFCVSLVSSLSARKQCHRENATAVAGLEAEIARLRRELGNSGVST